MWVGEMIPDIKQKILLVCEEGTEENAMIRLSRVGYDNTIGYLDRGFNSWNYAHKEIDKVNRIDAKELARKMNKSPIVVDVRKKSEFDSEHIIGAINIPLNQINQHLAELPKDEPFILHCESGYRSMLASSILKARGWKNFVDVRDGFKGIKETDTPVSEYVCPTTLL
jgi:rhodanese-related sulfurtransferase